MRRPQRLANATKWLPSVRNPTVTRYAKWYAVDRVTAATELLLLGMVSPEEVNRQRQIVEQIALGRRRAKERHQERNQRNRNSDLACWGEGGSAPEYGIAYVAGFTEGGFPFGITYEQLEEIERIDAMLAQNGDEIDEWVRMQGQMNGAEFDAFLFCDAKSTESGTEEEADEPCAGSAEVDRSTT